MRNKHLTQEHAIQFKDIVKGGVAFLATKDAMALQRNLHSMALIANIKITCSNVYASSGYGSEALTLVRVQRVASKRSDSTLVRVERKDR